MKRESSTEIFYKHLKDQGVYIAYDSFMETYLSESREQLEKADVKGFKEMDYQGRLEKVFKSLKIRDYESLSESAWKAYLAEWPKQTEFFPSTVEILENLRGKYKLGVITNYMDGPTCREVFRKLNFDEVFDSLVVSAEVGYRKPARTIFEYALRDTGSSAESSIMVGDTFEADIVGANLMGMRNILVDVYNSQHNYYKECSVVIKDISEFPVAFEKIQRL